ncbi:MAG TPA: hypothetical protein VIZ28_07850 [Chitinophagaceae bacterium]
MKTFFVLTLLFCTVSATSQSLKDSLFSGKLKNPHKQAEVSKDSAKVAATKSDAVTKTDSVSSMPAEKKTDTAAAKPVDTMPDSLNALYYAKQKAWKRFIDQQTMIITQQADESRKVKKGEYYIEFDYQIGLNGRVKASNIICNPQNEFLVATVTDIMSRPPVLAPPVYGDGKPRVASAKQQITILKK